MSEEDQNQSDPLKKITELPGNYYFYGDPGRVIDRVTNLAKLDGDPHIEDERQLFVKEVLTFCPVPFLDELIEALISKTQEAIKDLRDKASYSEINSRFNHIYSNEEKNQISALALKLLSEKINDANSEQILPILRLIQKYIEAQIDCQALANQKIAKLGNQINQLTGKIMKEKEKSAQAQNAIFIDFVGKLSNLDS